MNIYYKRRIKSLGQLGLITLVLLISSVGTAWAAPPEPYLVKDINTDTRGSSPTPLINADGTLFFMADDGVHGYGLYKSDGTQAGTALVLDLSPESGFSYLASLANVNDTLFFIIRVNDRDELWKSNGTQAGTVLVQVIEPGDAGSDPYFLTNVNGTLFFQASDDVHGAELWQSDGTAAGTVLVKDINPGVGGSHPSFLTNVGGTLFFSISLDDHVELWKSDGTAAGTVLVKDSKSPGANFSFLFDLTDVNGTLFFSSCDYGINGSKELWKSDGTAAGTVLVKDINPTGNDFRYMEELTNVNGTLFFDGNDGVNGNELWVSDGTQAGTMPLTNFEFANNFDLEGLTNVHGTLFFRNERELWKSDGTQAGTLLVREIPPGPAHSSLFSLTDVDGTLFFRAESEPYGRELWKSDGTQAGTLLVKDIKPGSRGSYPDFLVNVDGTLFFCADDGVHGEELYKSDGTEAGTVLVRDIEIKTDHSEPASLTRANGAPFGEAHDVLFFSADQDGVHGDELWMSDGTEAGTVLVKDVDPTGDDFLDLYGLTYANGKLFFRAYAGLFLELWKDELWVSDGTEQGTVMLKDLYSGPNHTQSSSLLNVNDTVFFFSDHELWKSDGTQAGTVLVKDFGDSSPANPTNVNGTLFFRVSYGPGKEQLWKSDGTEAGTVWVKTIRPEFDYVYLTRLTDVQGTLFFGVHKVNRSLELWKSDGTGTGTVVVKSFDSTDDSSSLAELTNVDGTLFFRYGLELWKSDGTEAGTVLVKSFDSADDSLFLVELTNVGGTLFFRADDGVHGRELYKSDGTQAGTVLVKDIYAGEGNSYPAQLSNVDGVLFFCANDGLHGYELWMSDGTEVGTVLVGDINPGEASSDPHYMTRVNDRYFFAADDDAHGTELWAGGLGAELVLSTQVITSTPFLLPGDAISFTLTYRNVGYVAASDVVISNPLPDVLTQLNVSSSGATITRTPGVTYTWQVEDLEPGAGGVISITAVIDPAFAGGVLNNTASISSAEEETNGNNNSSSVSVTVQPPPALRVFKTVQGPGGATTNLLPGDALTYTIALSNSLNELAAGVVLTDPLPSGVRFGGWVQQGSAQLPPPAGTGTQGAEVVYWGPWDILAGEEVRIVFTATIAPGSAWLGNPVVNTAWFSSTNAGSGSASAAFTVKVTDVFLPLLMKQ